MERQDKFRYLHVVKMEHAMGVYRPVRALERGLAVLRAANSLPTPTVEAIARETKLSWSTTFRLLETLQMTGYVCRHDTSRTFRPTIAARSLAEGFADDTWIAQIASPAIGRLSRKLVWPVDLMVLSADAMLIVETTHRSSPLSIDRNMIGRRLPVLLTAAGRCYLGHLKPRQQKVIVRRLAKRDDQEGAFARQKKVVSDILDKVRRDGLGVREGGLFPHTKSIAVPIRHGGEVLACISVIWITSALSMPEGISRFLEPLRKSAASIEQQMARVERHAQPAAGR